jgi:RecG-like helicase
MTKYILSIIYIILLQGCAFSTQNDEKISLSNKQNDIKTLSDLNKNLPKMIDEETLLVSIFKTSKNNKTIFMNSYVLPKIEKEFFDLQKLGFYMYESECIKKQTFKNSSYLIKYSYYDKSYTFIGEFHLSNQICEAMNYVYKNDIINFKKYLYSLPDEDFEILNLNYQSFLGAQFKKIYYERIGDIKIN